MILKNNTIIKSEWLVVVNPTSGGGKVFRRFAEIEKAFAKHNIKYELRVTQKRGDATEIVKKAILTEGYRRIMGIGGDGTGNEVINGIFAQNDVPLEDIIYTMYAAGTGNDCVRMHDIPNDLSEFCRMILRLYSGGVADIPEARLFKTKKIKVESLGNPIFCETDGEFIGPTPTEISIFKHKLRIVVP